HDPVPDPAARRLDSDLRRHGGLHRLEDPGRGHGRVDPRACRNPAHRRRPDHPGNADHRSDPHRRAVRDVGDPERGRRTVPRLPAPAVQRPGERTGHGLGAAAPTYPPMRLVVTEFMTLDGVMEAPGFEEHRDGRNGWAMQVADEELQNHNREQAFSTEAFLFGRTTYNIWAAFWPTGPE